MIERDWKSDPVTGELVVGDDIEMVSGVEAIRQDVLERLSYARGEFFLDPADPDALPVFEEIMVKAPNLAAVRSLYERCILATPGVQSILSIDLSLDKRTRTLSVRFKASTDLGEIEAATSVAVGG